MKNVVFIPNIDLGNGRNSSYNYSIQSWKKFCDRNDCELLVWEDLLYPVDVMKITWQRYYLFDILDSNNINLEKELKNKYIKLDRPTKLKNVKIFFVIIVNRCTLAKNK